jgi:hypothetical protein
MPPLRPMPPVVVRPEQLVPFGLKWKELGGRLDGSPPYSSSQLCGVFDRAVAESLAVMLGGLEIVTPNAKSLLPPKPDCVELGHFRVIGGVRPQNFDVGYRPDGVRFAFDSKSLNDKKSIPKNWQNMVNDISTEATTVHTRFPHAVVGFMVIYPRPGVDDHALLAMVELLERMARRVGVHNSDHMAESVSLVLWDTETGRIDPDSPPPASPLRIEKFSDFIYAAYSARYRGLPPHAADPRSE